MKMDSDRIEVNVPDGRSGPWRIESFTLTEDDVKFENMRAIMRRDYTAVCDPGHYKRLVHDRRGCVMSNTPMEVRTNRPAIRAAKGRVHINGLGLGMVLTAVLQKPEVEFVRVVEIDENVISLVAPHFAQATKAGRLEIVNADCYEYAPPKGERYEAAWHDVWDEICSDNLRHMTTLRRKYGRRARWQGCWSEEYLR